MLESQTTAVQTVCTVTGGNPTPDCCAALSLTACSLVAESLAMLPPIQAATTAAAADHSTNPSHASSPMHSHSGSHPWSAGSSGSGASGRSRSTAAAAAVGYGKGGRRFRRNVSLPDEHEEDEAALVAMLMVRCYNCSGCNTALIITPICYVSISHS